MTDAPKRRSIGARPNPAAEAAILKAAREVIAEKGYAGFSIDEVARRAGAGKPTVYRRWPTKAELFIAVYAEDKAAAMAPPASGDLAADIALYTARLWTFWREGPLGRTFRALIAEAQTGEAALAALREKFLAERLPDLRRMFAAAAERGEISPERVDPLVELYVGFNWVRLLTGRLDDDPQGIAAIAGILVRGGR